MTELLEMRKILWLRTGEASTVLRGIEHLPADKSASNLRWARQFQKEAVAGAPAEKQLMHDWVFSMARPPTCSRNASGVLNLPNSPMISTGIVVFGETVVRYDQLKRTAKPLAASGFCSLPLD